VFHLLDRHAASVGHIRRCTNCGTGITGRRLYEEFFDFRAGNDFLVQLHVQRAAARKGHLAGFLEDVAQVVVDHLQRQFFKQRLHAGRVVDVRLVGDIAFALWPQPFDQFWREVEPLALFFVATQTDHVGVFGVDHQFAVFERGQTREVVFAGVAVRRHAHDLEFAIQHFETEKLGNRAVQATQGVRVEEFLDLGDLAVFAVAEERRGVLTFAIDAQNRGFFFETRAVVGAGSVGQVMLNRFDLDFLRIKTQLFKAEHDLVAIAFVTTVTHQDRVKSAVRGVPIAFGIVPARLPEQADRSERDRHHINVGRFDTCLLKAKLCGFVGHAVLCMLITHEAFFFSRRYQLAVDIEGCGGIMAEGAGQAKNRQCHWISLFGMQAGGGRLNK